MCIAVNRARLLEIPGEVKGHEDRDGVRGEAAE